MAYLPFLIFLFIAIYYQQRNQKQFKNMQDELDDLKEKLNKIQGKTSDESLVENQYTKQNSHEKIVEKSKPTIEIPKTEFKIETPTLQEYEDFKTIEPTQPIEQKPSVFDTFFEFLKQNFLSVLGILTLVLGVGYFVKYAIDQNWINETLRVFLGLATGAGIIGIGLYLRKNYTAFSSILAGGGIAILYFTITIAFQQYHLFAQNSAFAILFAITVFAVGLAYYLKSEALIVFALLGGFAAPLMVSTGESNYPFLFSYIVVLNLGMLVISYLRNWKSLHWVSFVVSNIYLIFWIFDHTEYQIIWFVLAFYLIFYAFAFKNYSKNKDFESGDYAFVVAINFSYVLFSIYLFQNLELKPISLFPLIFAGINAVLIGLNALTAKFGVIDHLDSV